MNFRVLPGSAASPQDFDLGFRVLWRKESNPRLRISIHADVMKHMGWTAETRLQMLVDEEAGIGQLKASCKRGRRINLTNTDGRGECLFGYTNEESAIFEQWDEVTELVIRSKDKENGDVAFELPPAPTTESEE